MQITVYSGVVGSLRNDGISLVGSEKVLTLYDELPHGFKIQWHEEATKPRMRGNDTIINLPDDLVERVFDCGSNFLRTHAYLEGLTNQIMRQYSQSQHQAGPKRRMAIGYVVTNNRSGLYVPHREGENTQTLVIEFDYNRSLQEPYASGVVTSYSDPSLTKRIEEISSGDVKNLGENVLDNELILNVREAAEDHSVQVRDFEVIRLSLLGRLEGIFSARSKDYTARNLLKEVKVLQDV